MTILDLYFAPKFFEKNGLIYKLLGVHIFKRFLPTGGDIISRITKTRTIENGKTETLKRYEKYTRIYEAIHLTAFVGYIALIMINLSLYWVVMWVVLNLLINVYPIMVQRYNRGRIYKILQKRRVKFVSANSIQTKELVVS